MKKLIVGFIILSIIILFPRKEQTLMAFNEIDNTYKIYHITRDNLNTKNIFNYFDEDSILYIVPNINKIYMKDEINYPFNTERSINYNINKFKEYYLSLVDNYHQEKEKYILNGIPIKQLTIYMSSERLKELLNQGFTVIK